MNILVIFFAASFFCFGLSSVAEAQSSPGSHPVRAQCKKSSSGGCTGDTGWVCYDAPLGYGIYELSVRAGSTGAKGKQIICNTKMEGKSKIIQSPIVGDVKLFSKICLNAHIESGSGFGNIGQTFYNNCVASFTLVKAP